MRKDYETALGFSSEPQPAPQELPAEQAVSLSLDEVVTGAKESLDFLSALAMPSVFRYCFPPVFIAIWNWLTTYVHKTRDFSQLAIGLPRGFGKTMVIKLFILYCFLFTSRSFILIIAGTQTKANNIIADVMNMLTEPNILRVFGDWRMSSVGVDRQDFKEFAFRGRSIIFAGAGCQSDIRGITRLNTRPDVMIFDDIQTREEADSQEITEKIETWMYGTAMKTKSPLGCLYVFIANMYPTKFSMLRKLKANPTWIKFITGAITASGESIWEELQPLQQLLNEYRNDVAAGRGEIFAAEVLNDENASANNRIDISKLAKWEDFSQEFPAGRFIVIDPSNDKHNSDVVSIGYFEIRNTIPCGLQVIEGRFSPSDTIKTALKLALQTGTRCIGVESNAYQYSLLHWFQVISAQLGLTDFHFLELYSGSLSKNSRILTSFKSLHAKEIALSPQFLPAFLLQAQAFNPLKTNNTDGVLDLVTYAPKMIELYGPLILSLSEIGEQLEQVESPAGELETSAF